MIDPAIFDAEAKALGLDRWPEQGETIQFKRRGETDWHTADVELVWLGIEVAIDVAGTSIYPALGDRFRFPPPADAVV